MLECACCSKLKKQFDIATKKPHDELQRTYRLMRKLYDQQNLVLYMSDVPFESWEEEVRLEQHYTYYTYLKCRDCGKIYFLGVCIRGVPKYQVLEWEPDQEEFICGCLRDKKEFYIG